MDGGVAGTGPANLQDSLPRSGVAAGATTPARHAAAAAGLDEDQIAASLLNLADPQLGQLLDHLDQTRQALDPMLLDGLLRAAIAAAESRDLPGVMAAITELVSLDPERGVQMTREALPLAPFRGEVNDLLQRLEQGAKAEAERTLGEAAVALESAAQTSAATEASRSAQMLSLAQRFLETGQYINFVRAAELGQAVLAYWSIAPEDRNAAASRGRQASGQRPARPRRRTPVAVVLAWVSLGVLVLVVVQFILSRR